MTNERMLEILNNIKAQAVGYNDEVKSAIRELRREKIKEVFEWDIKYGEKTKLVSAIQSYNYAEVIDIVNNDDTNAFFNEAIRNNTMKETFDILNEILIEDYGIKNNELPF